MFGCCHRALGEMDMRHGELLVTIGGISRKRLTQSLQRLEGQGLIEHVEDGQRTHPLGVSLLEPVRMLSAWAEQRPLEIVDAQNRSQRERNLTS
jgi:DNA-binding HxlR family transcriptional regulator